MIRASILMLYLRLFPVQPLKTRVLIVQVLQLSFVILTSTSFWFECVPLKKVWEPSSPGVCVNKTLLVIFTAGINITMDFAVFVLPLPVLLQLQMPSRKKFALCGLFFTGSM